MNKRVLTKTFSFSKWFLFFVLALGITLTGCKEDYDDDINRIDGDIASIKTATEKIAGLETNLAAAKAAADQAAKDATDAKKFAEDALTKVSEAGIEAAVKKAEDALALAEDANKTAEALEEARAAMQIVLDKVEADLTQAKEDIAELKATGGGLTEEQMNAIVDQVIAKINESEKMLSAIIGHRLTSLVRIPTQTLNDEPAIIFQNISYVPQVFDPLHTPYTIGGVDQHDNTGRGEVTKDAGSRFYLSNEGTVVKYQVSPKGGVRSVDIGEPYFMGDIQKNTEMRAVVADYAGENKPIKVAKWELDNTTGVLSVNVTKNVPADVNINFDGRGTDTQTYYIASLRVPIAKENWTAQEISDGIVPEVASEYSRIAETTVVPMIKQINKLAEDQSIYSDAHRDHEVNYNRQELLNGQNRHGRYVHYHDSASLYLSAADEIVDFKVRWDSIVDLTNLVTVCEFEKLMIESDGTISRQEVGSHDDMDWPSYGLEFRFALPSTPYFQGSYNTDQQEFAEILDGYKMKSKVYQVPGETPTAIGREPIVRVQLIDTRNNNKLVAQRYIKFQWTDNTPPPTPIEVTFPESIVSCKVNDNQVFTQQMNVDFYRQLLTQGISKEDFHKRYKQVIIESLKKDGDEILNDAPSWIAPTLLTKKELDDTYNSNNGITVAQAEAYAKDLTSPGTASYENQIAEDVIFALAKDQVTSGNTTYNLKWFMSPAAVGPIDRTTGRSKYELVVRFVDLSGTNDLEVTFKQEIIIPTQNFIFQGPYWRTKGDLYVVNPIVYADVKDLNIGGVPKYAAGAWTGWNTDLDGYNHIGTDLVKGFVNASTQLIPSNVDEFIQYIRSCAEVRFEFDDARFGNYPHLAGYTVTNDRQALWSNSQAPLSDPELRTYDHPGAFGDARYDKLAATIWNQFGATAAENQRTDAKNMPWAINEPLGTQSNIASAQIWLSEIDESNGSTAASNLVGKKVPVQIVVEYNEYNKIPHHDYELEIVDPLRVGEITTDNFKDAKINGSYINVQNALNYTDWGNNVVSRSVLTAPDPNPTGADYRFTQQLWDFYQVRDVVFKTESARTNLRLVGDAYVPVEGETNGNLPGVTIRQVQSYDEATGGNPVFTNQDPVYLRYFNDDGTPVSWEYKIFMDVVVGYKWGQKVNNITINVDPATIVPPTVIP